MPGEMASLDPPTVPEPSGTVLRRIVDWYSAHARDLPWRGSHASSWSILVSEVMLQQTPVVRVLPVFESWMSRWPTLTELADSSSGDAVREWGRLGYPRRALRLHAAAKACVEHHAGQVPDTVTELRALPGVGEYTAAAVAVFAFRQRHAVLDTNVRRVYARVFNGSKFERPGAPTVAEKVRALAILPEDHEAAATASVSVMELGALCCSAKTPDCGVCPVSDLCAWLLAGRPDWQGPARRGQTYTGTDRQCRGRLLSVMRRTDGAVTHTELSAAWSDDEQRQRALTGLIVDGLIQPEQSTSDGSRLYSLPR